MNHYNLFLKHFSSYFFKQKIKHLILHVTNHCNFRCSHCFVDFEGKKKDMSLDSYLEISKNINDLFWLDIAGGEPFLRKDLHKIVNAFDKQIISIPTNGWLENNILEQIDLIDTKNSEFVVNLSLDGLKETHNLVRKNKDSWDKVWKTFEKLKKIEKVKTRFITVIHNGNYKEIVPLMKLIRDRGADFHSVILLRGDPMDNHVKLPSFEILDDLAPKIFNILETYDYGQKGRLSYFLRNYHRYLWKSSIDTLKKQTQVVPCLAGRSSLVVWGEGNVSSCEMLPSVGNLKEQKMNDILKSEKFKKQLKSIKNKECHCTHNCALVTSITFNPLKWQNLIYQKKPG